jgi:hypothetical protein
MEKVRLMDLARELGVECVPMKKALKKKSHMAMLSKAEVQYAKTFFAEPDDVSLGVSFPPPAPSSGSAPIEPDLKLIAASINGAGDKSPFWHLRHLVGRK